ncbi:MtrB/PioB family outer membrane beta-barrel protein [Tahibacter amnicola]|uniref:MtrB/PioB family outer membrane beta-barrel protein n=1 Tax=Tahibacter amnicola TaxID=2976241 RepID=A0ABY6B8X6_9GAMM|nr:MtrB/PioB family outer membrane beta-barrel protein [Tahibacter amnicola]UXI66518.1 MtrB/PioB family outer membrane beta-barrel protein [Tahibacter amnicola]
MPNTESRIALPASYPPGIGRCGACRAAVPLFMAFSLGWAATACADSGAGLRNGPREAGGVSAPGALDPRGTSWLHAGQRRSPGGQLYECPAPPPADADAPWLHASVTIGYAATAGDERNAQWGRFRGWDDGVVGRVAVRAQDPLDATYLQADAARLGEDDAYLQALFGRAGSFKVKAILERRPNLLSHTARPIWNGVGTSALTLPEILPAAASSVGQVEAVSSATPAITLGVRRERQALEWNSYLSPRWSLYAQVRNEHRKGARPFGGPFYYGFAFPDNAGALESVKPIDDDTLALQAGLRFAGDDWRMAFSYAGSFYRDRYRGFTFQMPYPLTPFLAGATSPGIERGQFASEPDNDHHRIAATFTRRLPWNGEASVTTALGRMHQNDTLIAPVDCTGVFGVDILGNGQPGPDNPYLYNCADWNSPASLSRPRAGLQIDTSTVNGRIALRPSDSWNVYGEWRFHRQDYRGEYLAFNPLTGQFGYIAENGAQGSILPGQAGFWDPLTAASVVTRIRSIPLDQETTEATIGADWYLPGRNTLGATVTAQHDAFTHRERRDLDDVRGKLTWINRTLDGLTLRANLSIGDRSGGAYDYAPHAYGYSTSLPGFVVPDTGIPALTVDAMRMYDLSDRQQRKADVMVTLATGARSTVNLSVRHDDQDYDASIGRQGYRTQGITLQWEWQPIASTTLSVHAGHDRSRLDIANINDQDIGSDPTLGGPTYPEAGRWWSRDQQRNRHAGATFRTQWRGVHLDAGWNWMQSRGVTSYRFETAAALAYFPDGTRVPGNQFPAMTYQRNSLSIGVTFPVASDFTVRVFDTYERARIQDWHYSGFGLDRIFGRRVYTDGGPESYGVNWFGVTAEYVW